MSDQALIDTMRAENDFCAVCLRTRTEVQLDRISTKMYQMFFVGLVKCVESETSRCICVWCRRRVVNALKLVEMAKTTDRMLTNITQADEVHWQPLVSDHIEANKRTYGLTPKIFQVISCNVPLDIGICLPIKVEHEDGIFDEEGKVCFDNVINEKQLYQTQSTEETPDLTSRNSEDVSCNSEIDSTMKLEYDDNEDELDTLVVESHDSLASGVGSETDDESTSQSNITEETPCHNEIRKWNNLKTYTVTKRKMKENKLNRRMDIEVLKPEPIDVDEDQNSEAEGVNENPTFQFGEQVPRKVLPSDESPIEIEDLDTNPQSTYSSTDASKHIHVVQLTEAQRLQELEERKHNPHYHYAVLKCEKCVLGFVYHHQYDKHMKRHTQRYSRLKCSVCGLHFKQLYPYQKHCKDHYKRYACKVCALHFLTRYKALYHFVSEHTVETFKCEICMCKFRTSVGLKCHVRMAHEGNGTVPSYETHAV